MNQITLSIYEYFLDKISIFLLEIKYLYIISILFILPLNIFISIIFIKFY